MPDPVSEREQVTQALDAVAQEARRYLEAIDHEPVLRPGALESIRAWSDPMPEHGDGPMVAIAELLDRARMSAARFTGDHLLGRHGVAGFGPTCV